MGMMKEFKDFAMKGNVVDLAVGVIIGGAFGKIVSALVEDIIMPPVSLLIGDKGFVNFFVGLNPAVRSAQAANPALSLEEARKLGPVLAWGDFITITINFIILAFIIFLMVKAMNSVKRKEDAAAVPATPPPPPADVQLLTEIRDLLKK